MLGLRFGDPSDYRSSLTHNRHFYLINNNDDINNNVNYKHVNKYIYNASYY